MSLPLEVCNRVAIRLLELEELRLINETPKREEDLASRNLVHCD